MAGSGSPIDKWIGSRYGNLDQTAGLQPYQTLNRAVGYTTRETMFGWLRPSAIKIELNNITDEIKITHPPGDADAAGDRADLSNSGAAGRTAGSRSVAPAAAASSAAVDRFQAAVRAAIQAAIVYPPSARMMKQQGRAKVAFTLVNGHADAPRIVQSSGIPVIDTAEVAAVRDAAYPAPPPELATTPLQFAVFVELNLTARYHGTPAAPARP